MKVELPRPISIAYRRPPRPPVLFPGILRKVTAHSLTIQSQLSVAKPRQVAGHVIAATGYWAIWFVFKDKWFDVGKFYDSSKKWLGYYCDIIKPVKRMMCGSKTTILTDLFLDIWITSDGSVYVLDQDELENAIQQGFVSKSLAAKAHSQVELLLRRIERHNFPPSVVKEGTLLD
jgi:predicted RNA-binding protein associated with RNAse of E/G family